MNIVINSIIETVSSWTWWQTIVCIGGSIILPVLGWLSFRVIVNIVEHKKNKHCVWRKFTFEKEHKKGAYKENWL